jgi:hypothetical protein
VTFTDQIDAAAKAGLKSSDTWTWTYTSSQTTSDGQSETATVTIGGPSLAYDGPTVMGVYYDILYKTFAFAPVLRPATLHGNLVSVGTLLGKSVSVSANGVSHRTFTNARGEWKFHGIMNGPCSLQIGDVRRAIPNCATPESIEVQLAN